MHQLEQKILDDIRKDDKKAFETLFKSYFGQLLNYAKEILKDHDLAEEVTEETFVKFWENRKKIIIDTSIRAYLFRSVYNLCLNYFKHQKIREKHRLFFQNHVHPDHLNSNYSFDFPLSRIFRKELEHLIEESIKRLPNQCREIFILSRYEEINHERIASKLSISKNTVKTQISRALIKIRKDIHEFLTILL